MNRRRQATTPLVLCSEAVELLYAFSNEECLQRDTDGREGHAYFCAKEIDTDGTAAGGVGDWSLTRHRVGDESLPSHALQRPKARHCESISESSDLRGSFTFENIS